MDTSLNEEQDQQTSSKSPTLLSKQNPISKI